MSNKKNSPFKLDPFTMIGVGTSIAGSIFGAVSANQAKKEAEEKERKARAEMNRLKEIYKNLDTSNPYLNMENVMEDLTVNQQQAEFQREQFQQTQANIMGGLRGAAVGSGVNVNVKSTSVPSPVKSWYPS